MVRKRIFEKEEKPVEQENKIQLVTENQLLNSKLDYIISLLEEESQ